MTADTTTRRNREPAERERTRAASRHVFDAECALHIAHQSHVESWVEAASQRLHEALAEYLTALGDGENPADLS